MSGGKLVRDGVPDLMIADGELPNGRVLDREEFKLAIELKLQEELQEVLSAGTTEERIAELADLEEALTAYREAHGISTEQLEIALQQKRRDRGGFDRQIWMDFN